MNTHRHTQCSKGLMVFLSINFSKCSLNPANLQYHHLAKNAVNSRKKAILACTYFGAAICYFDFVAPNSCKDQNKTPNPAVSCLSFFVSHKIILIESHDLILQQFSSLKSPKLFSYCLYRSHSVFLIIHYRPYRHFLLFCLTFFCFFRWQHKGA